MSQWWTYRLSSFLLFSPRTWLRLLEIYNTEIWPLQLVMLAIGVAMAVAVARGGFSPLRIVAAVLAMCWIGVAWGFLYRRYAPINWAATYFALAFGLEAILLAGLGAMRGASRAQIRSSIALRGGLLIVGVGLFAQPAIGWLAGTPLARVQYFGVAPDPTAVATMGFVLAGGRRLWLLLPIPILWCAVSAAFAWAMGLRDAWAAPAAALIVVALAGTSRFRAAAA